MEKIRRWIENQGHGTPRDGGGSTAAALHCREARPAQSPDLGEEAAVDGAGEHPPQARRKPVHDGQALRARQERNVMGQAARACVRP